MLAVSLLYSGFGKAKGTFCAYERKADGGGRKSARSAYMCKSHIKIFKKAYIKHRQVRMAA